MATTTHHPGEGRRQLVRTARVAGLLYLAMCGTAVFGHFVVPAQIFDPGDAAATLRHLVEREALARFGIAMELATATLQALLALWLFRLFRPVDAFAAGSLAALGWVNAVTVVGTSALLGAALEAALAPSFPDAAAAAQSLYLVRGQAWHVVAVFCGLWLLPMGRLVLRSGWMPRPLGWLLLAGGVGYVLYAFLVILLPDAAPVAAVLVWPSASELWMAVYLAVRGVRRRAPALPADAGAALEMEAPR